MVRGVIETNIAHVVIISLAGGLEHRRLKNRDIDRPGDARCRFTGVNELGIKMFVLCRHGRLLLRYSWVIGIYFDCDRTRSNQARMLGYCARSNPPSAATWV